MNYRKLGKSTLEASEIGFGCWVQGGEYGTFDKKEFMRAVDKALDIGVNMFDTAYAYGLGASEALLGEALRERRSEALICTKIGVRKRKDGVYYQDSSRDTLLAQIDESLNALKTESVDLLLIHWPDATRGFDEPMEALCDIQKSGKARFIGVSNFNSRSLAYCAKLAPITVNQVGYSLFDRRWEYEMFPTAAELEISIMAYGPLAHGLLAGEFNKDTQLDDRDWRSEGLAFGQPLFEGDNLRQNVAVVRELTAVADEMNVRLPQLALAWVLHTPVVSTALTGVRTASQIAENADASSLELSESTVERVEEIMKMAAGMQTEVPA